MTSRTGTRPPTGGDAPPRTPAVPVPPLDEGPMRRELLRQIAQLDADLSARQRGVPQGGRSTPKRGPAVQPTAQLERIRDELLTALDALRP